MTTTIQKRNLGELSKTACVLCGRRHHWNSTPAKCIEAETRADYMANLAYDRVSYSKMPQVEKDAYDNL